MFTFLEAKRFHDELSAMLGLLAAIPRWRVSEKRFRRRSESIRSKLISLSTGSKRVSGPLRSSILVSIVREIETSAHFPGSPSKTRNLQSTHHAPER